MKVLTVKFDDHDYDELVRVAESRGVSLSDLTRSALEPLLRSEASKGAPPGEAPRTMTTYERRMLALQHRTLARLVADGNDRDAGDDDGDREYQLGQAQILERGFIEEYSAEFETIEPELSAEESAFVMDVLDMFTMLEESLADLAGPERQSLGADAQHGVTFPGFDLNDRRESRLLGYARYLVDQRRWPPMAKHLNNREQGNSHMPRYDVYARMLKVFNPIKQAKFEQTRIGQGNGYNLSADEIRRVLDARTR